MLRTAQFQADHRRVDLARGDKHLGSHLAETIIYNRRNPGHMKYNRKNGLTSQGESSQRRIAFQHVGQCFCPVVADLVVCTRNDWRRKPTKKKKKKKNRLLTGQFQLQNRLVVFQAFGQRLRAVVADSVFCDATDEFHCSSQTRRKNETAARTVQSQRFDGLVALERVGQRLDAVVADIVLCKKASSVLFEKKKHSYCDFSLSQSMLLMDLFARTAPAIAVAPTSPILLSARNRAVFCPKKKKEKKKEKDKQIAKHSTLTIRVDARHRCVDFQRCRESLDAVDADIGA